MAVINAVHAKSMLAAWDEVRKGIVSGSIDGLAVCSDGPEGCKCYFAGAFEQDTDEALRAAMKISWELTRRQGREKQKK